MTEETRKYLAIIRERTDFVPKVALTLGSGLGGFADTIQNPIVIPYADLPGFPVSTAPGHEGKFIMGMIGDVPVICMKGRVHSYEGYSPEQVCAPAKVMQAMGAQILFLTNAAGGSKSTYHPGTLALVTDHVSLFIRNPLIGPNDEEEGVRFPDMTQVYDAQLREMIQKTAAELSIPLDTGVYVQLSGPSFETPSEIRLLSQLGVTLFGMSTVQEAIAARHMGMKVCCISLVSNLAAGISGNKLTSEEVEAAGKAAEPLFTKLVTESIKGMKNI